MIVELGVVLPVDTEICCVVCTFAIKSLSMSHNSSSCISGFESVLQDETIFLVEKSFPKKFSPPKIILVEETVDLVVLSWCYQLHHWPAISPNYFVWRTVHIQLMVNWWFGFVVWDSRDTPNVTIPFIRGSRQSKPPTNHLLIRLLWSRLKFGQLQ